MKQKPSHGLWYIALTFFIGFYLAAIPMGRFEIARPDWVGMLIIFWVLILPERFGIFIAFLIGLLFDTLAGTLLGLYGLVYAVLAYTVLLLHSRLKMYPLGQQAMVVFLILGVTHIVSQWLKIWLMSLVSGELHIWPALTSAMVWPWVYGILRTFQLRLRVQ
ncbi:MAG: rod shape-determining protein MreD [Reinekea sp.]|jgi:rod shape-determining protein MreD